MSFTGKYERQIQENFESCMKAVGLSDEQIEKAKSLKTIAEIVQKGQKFKVTMTTGEKAMTNEFEIGVGAELDTTTGQKIKTVVNMEGDHKLLVNLKDVKSVTELCGDTLVNTLTKGDVQYKSTSKNI